MVYTCNPEKISIYVNTDKLSAKQVREKLGCDAVINGGLYNMSTFEPLCHLKVNGKVLVSDPYGYWGYAWDKNQLVMTADYSSYQNYICCVCLVCEGQAEPLIYNSDMGGSRPRTVLGTKDGKVVLMAFTNGWTPEALQQYALSYGFDDAIMLDGGNSTQMSCPDGEITSSRRVHNLICVWARPNILYKVQVGAFSVKSNAERLRDELKMLGYNGFITEVEV